MAVPVFPNIPDAPNRSTDSQASFDSKAEAFTEYLADDFSTDMNTYAEDLVDAAAAAGYSSVSTTSVAIGTGSKSFTVETGKMFVGGQFLVIADAAAPTTNYMWGQVTSYNSSTGALVFNSLAATGSGTKTSWLVGLSGPQGATGGSQLDSPAFTGTPSQEVETMVDSVSTVIDPALGSIKDLTLTGNRALTNTLGNGQFALLDIKDGSGFTITSWDVDEWHSDGGIAPTLETSGSTLVIIGNIGGTVHGSRVGDS